MNRREAIKAIAWGALALVAGNISARASYINVRKCVSRGGFYVDGGHSLWDTKDLWQIERHGPNPPDDLCITTDDGRKIYLRWTGSEWEIVREVAP